MDKYLIHVKIVKNMRELRPHQKRLTTIMKPQMGYGHAIARSIRLNCGNTLSKTSLHSPHLFKRIHNSIDGVQMDKYDTELENTMNKHGLNTCNLSQQEPVKLSSHRGFDIYKEHDTSFIMVRSGESPQSDYRQKMGTIWSCICKIDEMLSP